MIERAIRWLAAGLATISGLAVLLMMVQTVVDVASSNFLGRPIEGNLEIMSVYHMVVIVFLPLAFVEMKHEHITVELLVQTFPAWLRRVTEVIGYAVSTAFFAMLSYQTWLDAIESYRIGEILMTSMLITIWPAKFSLPIGFTAIMLVMALHTWKSATDPTFDPVPENPEIPADPS